jgi:hypothetical protein
LLNIARPALFELGHIEALVERQPRLSKAPDQVSDIELSDGGERYRADRAVLISRVAAPKGWGIVRNDRGLRPRIAAGCHATYPNQKRPLFPGGGIFDV